MPAYHELAKRYNANLAGLDRMWARASVKLFFRDDRGKWKTETGEDSSLMLEPPYNVGLSLGKLGKTAMWAGCNKDQYWLFDVMESRTVWYGRTASIGAAKDFPLPVLPQRLIPLLGAMPINPDVATEHGDVKWEQGLFVIDVPEEKMRLWIEPRTALPRKVALLDNAGEWLVIATLSGEMAIEKQGVPKERWPRVPDRAEIAVNGLDGTLTLWLKDGTDGRANSRIDRALKNAFDFAVLVKSLSPQKAIDLDR